jgi:hypothetical protein
MSSTRSPFKELGTDTLRMRVSGSSRPKAEMRRGAVAAGGSGALGWQALRLAATGTRARPRVAAQLSQRLRG